MNFSELIDLWREQAYQCKKLSCFREANVYRQCADDLEDCIKDQKCEGKPVSTVEGKTAVVEQTCNRCAENNVDRNNQPQSWVFVIVDGCIHAYCANCLSGKNGSRVRKTNPPVIQVVKLHYTPKNNRSPVVWQVLFNIYREMGGDLNKMNDISMDLFTLKEYFNKAEHGFIVYWGLTGNITDLSWDKFYIEQNHTHVYRLTYKQDVVTIEHI